MSHGAGTEVSISERRRAAPGNPCYGFFQASTEAFSLLCVVSLEVVSARNLQRGQAKHSDSELVHTVLLDLWIEKTQAILRVAEHQAGVRKPKACGSCVQECGQELVRMVVKLIYIDDDTPSSLMGMSL